MGIGFSRSAFMATTAIVCVAAATPACAQAKSFDVPAQSATTGIAELGRQADIQIVAARRLTEGKQVNAVRGDMTVEQALAVLLRGTGLTVRRTGTQTWSVVAAAEPQAASTDDGGYRPEEIVVTAQKRKEAVQDVPIAISAFSEKTLEEQKIEGGFDLLKAIPNVTFSKSNFTSYNFSIRGVGTKAVSATTDPGVAVAFNNSTLIHNRLFEQEYLDVERVEVLRGPQGTLYGRNATSGVINVISRRPKLGVFEGSIKGEVGNFDTRRMSATLNVPLVDDVLALRFAGSMTSRDGYDYNSITQNRVNGRDLWSGRVSARFEPSDSFRANFVWERFREDDDRSRTGKQLCHRDDGPDQVGSVNLADKVSRLGSLEVRKALFSQGCKPGSLYDDAAFGTPNGLSYNFMLASIGLSNGGGTGMGRLPGLAPIQGIFKTIDPYGGLMQSRDLREIASVRDPVYRAGADLLEFNMEYDITPSLTFTSQTVFNNDKSYSFQDYNRFNGVPIFNDTSVMTTTNGAAPSQWQALAPGGIFCDPQIGCTDKLAGFDISSSRSKQFNQEFRIQSSFDGPFNFSLGANYTHFKTVNEYYVMFNALTAMAWSPPFYSVPSGKTWDPSTCYGAVYTGFPAGVPSDDPTASCPYVDLNPVESIDGEGHNYFRSSNPYKLRSSALFGEAYWNIRDDLKLTAGLRYTEDRKTFRIVPSQTLTGRSFTSGGLVSKGHPERGEIRQKWGEFTGRIGLDWKPDLSFTDDTLLYGFYSRGYKAGGANPPQPEFATFEQSVQDMRDAGATQTQIDQAILFNFLPVLTLTAVEYGPTFKPEFVNAFEIGMKNSLMNGRLSLNLTGFYYDYKDYQVSQIRDRTAVNENFDAKTWGLELESVFAPTPNLRLNANLGYLRTRIGKGQTSIDIMNRTQGDPNYTLVKPWMQLPSNCVVPTHVAESWAAEYQDVVNYYGLCGGVKGAVGGFFPPQIHDPKFGGALYDPANYPELNGGAGIRADLGGNELPNAPHWTANFGAQYTIDFSQDWSATLRGDAYWQGKSWARVYNLAPYDRLRDWTNFNLSLRVDGPENLTFEAYVKNVFNKSPITDAFLNSDDTGLTTNVFTLDPRIIGFSIAKKF